MRQLIYTVRLVWRLGKAIQLAEEHGSVLLIPIPEGIVRVVSRREG